MHIALLEVRISLPEARSLKDKRMTLRALRDRVLNRMNVSVAEVGEQNQWRAAELAFVTVSAERDVADKRVAELRELLTSTPRFVVCDMQQSWL